MPGPSRQREPRDRARARAGNSWRDPPRRCGTRCRAPLDDLVLSPTAGRSPEATRSWAWTRSTPVTSSVTGMLDLQPGIHLEEVELLALHDELHRPRVHVADGARAPHRRRREPLLERGARAAGAGRLLDQLLVAPLDRALALVQVHHPPRTIADDLHLDVARGRRGSARRRAPRPEGRLARRWAVANAAARADSSATFDHADAAAPRRGLQQDRDSRSRAATSPRRVHRRDRALAARHHGHARLPPSAGARRPCRPCPG